MDEDTTRKRLAELANQLLEVNRKLEALLKELTTWQDAVEPPTLEAPHRPQPCSDRPETP